MCFDDLYFENEYSFDHSFRVSEAVIARLEMIKGPGRKISHICEYCQDDSMPSLIKPFPC